MSTEDQPQPSTLVGKWVHVIEKGEIEGQGKIVSMPAPGTYMVQLYDWLAGEPNCLRLVPLSEMSDWRFYDTSELMADTFNLRLDNKPQADAFTQRIRRKYQDKNP